MNIGRPLTLVLLAIFSASVFALPPESCGIGDPVTLEGIPDADSDNVSNPIDNCVNTANSAQLDTDGDGFGNFCDADYNNDGFVNFLDFSEIQMAFDTANANIDLTGDGYVNFLDLGKFSTLFNMLPGPTGPCIETPSLCTGPAYFEFDSDFSPGTPFVLEANAPEEVYHARRFVNGQSTCNGQVAASIEFVPATYNPNWSFSMIGGIDFHGSNIEPIEVCDASASYIELNGADWCGSGGGTRQAGACDYWCPWHYTLTQEVIPTQ